MITIVEYIALFAGALFVIGALCVAGWLLDAGQPAGEDGE